MKRQKSLLSLLLALLMVCNMIVPVSAEGANEPVLTVTASKTELDVSEGTADVIYTVSLNPNGNNICAFQFELTAPDGMKLTQDKAKKEGAEGYWINNKLRYVEEYNEDGLFTTFEYAPKTGYFGASGGLADRCLTETATIMTIKATVDVSNAKTYTLGVSKFICYGAGSVNFGGAAPAVTDVVVKGAAHTCDMNNLTKVEAKDPTCEADGCKAYWICLTCDKRYSDEKGVPGAETTLEEVRKPATGHAYGDLIPEVPATCVKDGMKAHYKCSSCGKLFDTDKHWVMEETNLVIPATGEHDWEIIKGADGSSTHTLKCKSCNKTVDEVHADRPGDESKTWESDKDNHWHVYGCGTIMNKAAHTWDEGVVTKEATCTEPGEKTFTCNVCHATKTEPINATGHKYEWKHDETNHWQECSVCHDIIDKAEHTYASHKCEDTATCTKAECGYVKPAGQHSWDEGKVTVPATCTTDGVKTFTCKVCSETKTEPIKAAGHTVVEDVAKEPTCTETGLTAGKHCSVCNEVLEAQTVIPAKGHSMTKTEAKAATCTEAGNSEYYTCDNCGKFFSDADGKNEIAKDSWVIKALGHDFTGAWVNTDAAGHYHKCTRCDATDTVVKHTFNGKPCNEEDKCTVCGYVKAAGVHAWGTAEYKWGDDNMSCTATVKCTNCEAVETDTAIIGIDTTPATCTVDGKTVYTATFSSNLFTTQTKEVTIDKLGHTYGAPVWSWSEDGKTATATFTCTREGCTAETTGHAQTVTATVSGKQNVAPTCTDKGTTTYTAKVTFEKKDYADTKDVQDIKALGHTLTKTAAKAATCTEAGNNEYWTCSVCKKVFKADKTIETTVAAETLAALGHTLTETPAVTPTCAAGGNNEYWTCSVCHKVFKADKTTETTVAKETLAKDPANHTGGTEQRGAVAASCMTAGRTADTYCKGCGKLTKAGDLIPPTGVHNYKDGVCTTCGSKQPADNATIKAAIEDFISDVVDAAEELKDKIEKSPEGSAAKKILEKLQGYVSGSSRSKLQAVYNVTMKRNNADLKDGETLADGQNVTIAISEETYNALRSGAKIVESYLDDKGEAQTREINATLKQVGGGYTVTFTSDKTAVYGLMTKTSSGGSSGSGSSYTSGQSFTTDLPADSINRVTVNGKKLDSKYYTVSSNGSGSIVTLTDAYLATLKAGKYTVKIENKTHVSTGTFTIKADGTLSSPKTADAGIALYAMLAVSSLMGTAVVSKKRRKA